MKTNSQMQPTDWQVAEGQGLGEGVIKTYSGDHYVVYTDNEL